MEGGMIVGQVRTADVVSEQELGELRVLRPKEGYISSCTERLKSTRPAGRKRRLRIQGHPDAFRPGVRLEATVVRYVLRIGGGCTVA